jgi:hypothetical protein
VASPPRQEDRRWTIYVCDRCGGAPFINEPHAADCGQLSRGEKVEVVPASSLAHLEAELEQSRRLLESEARLHNEDHRVRAQLGTELQRERQRREELEEALRAIRQGAAYAGKGTPQGIADHVLLDAAVESDA